MAVRLHLKTGLIGEEDRLPSSPDTILVHEPSTGSVSRSKGSLFVVIGATPGSGGRTAAATALVAEAIRRDYYYDESGGIPITLEKAIRNANRRLRHTREGHGIAPGTLGGVVAVVRGYELYVAAIGDGDAFLVRQARLLTIPEGNRGDPLPSAADVHVDVWRGDIAVGDSLILATGNVTKVLGTDELKNAVVTLHPQSAAEHLHHLFVTAGGEGSDGLLVVEATEVAATRIERRLVAVKAAEPLAGAPEKSPIPLADPLTDAAAAVGGGARHARRVAGGVLAGIADRLTGLLPARGPRHRTIVSPDSRRESQQRAAFALLAFLGVVLVLGVAAWYLGGRLPDDDRIPVVSQGENAVASAEQRISEVFGEENVINGDDEQALRLLREAWGALDTAEEAGVSQSRLEPLRSRVTDGLDELYAVRRNDTRTAVVYSRLVPTADMVDLVPGPDGAAYAIDSSTETILRYDFDSEETESIISVGDGPGEGIGPPWKLIAGGPDVLIMDTRGGLWRWRPSDRAGRGTLAEVRVGGDEPWGDDVTDAATFVRSEEDGLYNLYVVDPSERQIRRYLPAADGSGFPSNPTGYLATATDVSEFRQLYVDGDIYALTSQGVIRHENGRATDFELEALPDDTDVRPRHDFRLIAGTGPRGEGRLYIWDARHRRIVVYDKADGAYVEQFIPEPPETVFKNMRGMYVEEGTGEEPARLIWIDGERLRISTLADAAPEEGEASPAPSEPGAEPSASPGEDEGGEDAEGTNATDAAGDAAGSETRG